MTVDQIKKEERNEFWGLSAPSTLASAGLIIGTIGALMAVRKVEFALLNIIGIVALITAIRMNLKRDLSIKWRKANVALHIFFLVVIALALAAVLLIKSKGMF